MEITRQSMLTGNQYTVDLDITHEQVEQWAAGVPIQVAMGNLHPDDREFILTGIPREEWELYMGDKDPDWHGNEPTVH